MTALLELRNVSRSYPSGEEQVAVLKRYLPANPRRGDGGDRRRFRFWKINADEYPRVPG